MKKSRPQIVTLVALLQFIPAFLLPPDILLANPLLTPLKELLKIQFFRNWILNVSFPRVNFLYVVGRVWENWIFGLCSGESLLLLAPLALFAFMAWAMLKLKRWALTLCIFVQGMNVIVRFLILFPQATTEGSANWLFIITSLLAIALSSTILYVIDQPNVQVAFKA